MLSKFQLVPKNFEHNSQSLLCTLLMCIVNSALFLKTLEQTFHVSCCTSLPLLICCFACILKSAKFSASNLYLKHLIQEELLWSFDFRWALKYFPLNSFWNLGHLTFSASGGFSAHYSFPFWCTLSILYSGKFGSCFEQDKLHTTVLHYRHICIGLGIFKTFS